MRTQCHVTSSVPQTALLNIYSYTVRLCKTKEELKPKAKRHLPKKQKECFTALPAIEQEMSLSKAALRRKTEENPGTKKMARTNADGRTVPASPTTCLFAQCLSPVIYSGFFPGHQLKLLMASLGHFYLHQVEAWPGMCHGCKYPKQGPRRAGKCSENNDTPLLPMLKRGSCC